MDFAFNDIASAIGGYLGAFFGATWWFWLFFVLFASARSAFLYWRNTVFEHAELSPSNGRPSGSIMLEMKIPREILRSPRSMDQFFQAVAYFRNVEGDLGEKYLDGEVTVWYSFEIVSFSGEIHFYIRLKKKQRMLLEAAMFSYYPEVELVEVEDYTKRLPHHVLDMKEQNLKLWGSEMVLAKEGGWPLNTYMEFENMEEAHQVDPMATFIENLGKARKGEFVGIQYNCVPKDPTGWSKEYEYIVEELRTPQMKPGHGGQMDQGELIKAVALQKSPGQTDILKAVERNLSKPAFDVVIRFLYIAPAKIYYDSFPRRAIRGAFNQFGSSDLNSFVMSKGASTRVRPWNWPFLFSGWRNLARQQRLLHNYLEREHSIHQWMGRLLTSHPLMWNVHTKSAVISTEGMASLFHPPTNLITTAPHTQRVESKKMGAPAGLPIYADEDVLTKYS